MTGEVGVVIPCRNVARCVEDSLNSLVSYNEIHSVVCVDDGSTDGTADILHGIAGKFPFVIEVLQSGGAGAGAARNLGLAAIEAPFCQFLDADDLLLPGKLERQLGLAKRAAVDVVAGSYILRPIAGADRRVAVVDSTWRGLLTSRLGCTSAMLFRADAVRAVGGWAESLQSSQEYDLVFRMAVAGSEVATSADGLTVKRERVEAISSGVPAPRLERFIELRSRMMTHLASTGQLTPELEAEGNDTIFRSIQRIGETDRPLAKSLFNSHMPAGFVPAGSTIQSRAYRAAFQTLGFVRSETIRLKVDGAMR